MDYQILSEEKWCACQAGEKSVKETFKDLSYFGSDGVWNYYGSITENGITTLMRIKQTFKKCKDCEKNNLKGG